jgi:primosomal replication protein N
LNRLVITGSLVELAPLRATPAGVPVLEFQLAHDEEVIEAGVPRRVQCDISVVALAEVASMYKSMPLGSMLEVEGFIAAARKGSSRIRLHATHIRFVETDPLSNS